jgi:hypothetical protein
VPRFNTDRPGVALLRARVWPTIQQGEDGEFASTSSTSEGEVVSTTRFVVYQMPACEGCTSE